ncbi:S-layer homology domain-containing protein [Microcoleus sp. FACHB-68]|uniref:S-layer homology domain-containing protein n=1 Tax=Microcoleus sp. FACHB-68 TaxID=2692826 RepID=UPI00168738D3|nr:S-layer homology domain-containing protein [Microcoleus sp. FACHB-68]MBD1936807.1 S-layer homology domain-containing protein [Microcoleus sp. FACHB-68]
MSNLPPSDPRSPRDNPLGFDELIAIVVTFSTIGTILLVSLMRDDPKFFEQFPTQSPSPSPQLQVDPTRETEEVPQPAGRQSSLSEPPAPKPVAVPATPVPAAIVAIPTPQKLAPTAKPKPGAKPEKSAASPSSSLPVKTLPVMASVDSDIFRDVPKAFWARPFVNSIAQRGIVAGFVDNTYRPTKPVTRAEFAAIVSKTFKAKSTRPAAKFTDVPSNHWAASKIEQATRSGFLSAEPPLLKPYQPMTRVDVLVSLANGLGLKPKSDPAKILKVYQDADKIPKNARAKVAAATEMGLVFRNPNAKLLNPTQNASRADIADVIYKALVIDGQAEKKPPKKPAK